MMMRRALTGFFASLLLTASGLVRASVGLDVIPAGGDFGPITLFYPSAAPSAEIKRGPFRLDVALKGAPVAGNRRLVVISHGSGGSAWPHSDLARTLVEAGFVVALPEHAGDNWHDTGKVGPESWRQRPAEVSHAIDAVAADARFAPPLELAKVGVYGMSAGGHTALVLAGGRWSEALFARHCERHIEQDFPACVGLITRLQGKWSDGLKIAVAKQVIRWRFSDAAWLRHNDPRIQAVVAAVPQAAVFDLASLEQPRVPLGLIVARRDAWLAPRFHVEAVRKVCITCTVVADLVDGGHGSVLSPLSGELSEAERRLIADPPGFDRSVLPAAYRAIANFFTENLKP